MHGSGEKKAAPRAQKMWLLLILTLFHCLGLGRCNSSLGSGSSLLNPISEVILSVNEGVNSVNVIWTDESISPNQYRINYTVGVEAVEVVEIASDSVFLDGNSTQFTITGAFIQNGVTIDVSVEAVVGSEYCDPVFNSTTADGEFSPTPENFVIRNPMISSLTLSWNISFPSVQPESFSLSYLAVKLSGTLSSTNSTITIFINDSNLQTSDNESFVYVLDGLNVYTDYSVNLTSNYSGVVSGVAMASETTSEGESEAVEGLAATITYNDSLSLFSITINWNMPSEPNGVIINYSYTVFETADSNNIVASGDIVPLIVSTNLTDGQPFANYTVEVVPNNGAGKGASSSITTLSPEIAPGAVGNLTAQFLQNETSFSDHLHTINIEITWREPAKPNGVIQSYSVTVYRTDNTSDIVYDSGNSNGTLVEVNLTVSVMVLAYTNYTVSVMASTSAGEGVESSVTIESPEAAPGPIGNLGATLNTTGALFNTTTKTYTLDVNITWTQPLYTNGIIRNYSVSIAQTDNSTREVYQSSALDPNVIASDVMLLAYTNYTVTVLGFTSAGEGEGVTTIFLTPEAEPGAVANLNAFFDDAPLDQFDCTSNEWNIDITITWSQPLCPNGIITGYNVTIFRTNNQNDVIYSNDSVASPNVTVPVIVPAYTNYTVTVAAFTSVGTGEEVSAVIISPEAAPGVVGDLEASFGTASEFNTSERLLTVDINIMWTEPVNPNGVIVSYTVTVHETDSSSSVVYNSSSQRDTNVTVSVMVLPFTNYTITVSASTAAGEGKQSSIPIISPQAVPGIVENLNASFNTTQPTTFNEVERMYSIVLEIEWDEPLFPNGEILSYRVTVYQSNDSSMIVYSNDTVVQTNVSERVRVRPYTNYTVSVVGSTSAGEGDENFATTESPQAEPGPVGGLQSSFSDTNRTYEPSTRTYTLDLIITWTEPLYPNGVVTSYQVRVTPTDNTSLVIYRENALQTPNVTQSVMVLAFTNYTVTVAASTMEGMGNETSVTIISPQAAPGEVENLNAIFVDEDSVFDSVAEQWNISIRLSWDEPVYPNGDITSYRITVSLTQDSMDIVFSDNVTVLSVTKFDIFRAFTNYTVSVSAFTSAGEGNSSTLTIISPEAAPSEVRKLTASFGDSTNFNSDTRQHTLTVNITWNIPEYPNGGILSYEVSLYQTGNSGEIVYQDNVTGLEVAGEEVMVLPFTSYTVTVVAYTSAGRGNESSISLISPEAAPSQVQNLNAMFIFSTPNDFNSTTHMWSIHLNITWTLPQFSNGEIDNYTVTVCQTESPSNQLYSNTLTVLDVVVPLVVPAYINYTVTVAALTSAGKGENSSILVESPEAAPGVVGNLEASFGTASEFNTSERLLTVDINITWTKPVNPNGVIVSYTVTVHETDSSSSVVYNSSSQRDTNVTVSVMVLPFTNYTITVSASTAAGGGAALSVRDTSPQAAPSPPRAVMGEPITSQSIRVSWTKPEFPNGIIIRYRITYSLTSDGSGSEELLNTSALSVDIVDLTPYTNYTISVRAETVDIGERSPEVIILTLEDAPTAPRNVTTSVITSESVVVLWEEPASLNGIIRGYNVSNNVSDAVVAVSGSGRSANITGLTPFTPYLFSVIAITVEAGPPDATSATTAEAAPNAPRNLAVTETTAFTVSLSWEPPEPANGIVDSYIIRYTETNVSPENFIIFRSDVTSVTVDSLMAFTPYTFRVSAVTIAEGLSVETSTTTLQSTPTAPQNVMAVNSSSTSIIVSWTPPVLPRGTILSYTITYYVTLTAGEEEEGSATVAIVDGEATSGNVTDLMKYTNYSVYVQASTSVGAGNRSDVVTVFTDEDTPDAPTNLTVNERGPNSIIANWSSPANPNGIILHYIITLHEVTNNGSSLTQTYQVLATEGVNDYSLIFVNLTAFTLYRVTVSAVTRIGAGDEERGFVNTDPDSASPPTNVAVVVVNSTSIQLSWGYPVMPQGNITGYTIFTNATTDDGGFHINLQPINNMQDQTYIVTGLAPFTYYEFSIIAFSATHIGQMSETTVVQTDQFFPTEPIGFTLNSVDNEPEELMASWSRPNPTNGIITAYTITCTLSPIQYYPEQEPTEGSGVAVRTIINGDQFSLMISGLLPFTNYSCSLTANTSIGESPPTGPLYQRTVEDRPSAPQGLRIETRSLSELEVFWMRPIPSNGIITTYTIYCSGSGNQFYLDQINPSPFTESIAGEITSRLLSGLLPFTNYTCSISASTSAGEGDRSANVTQSTLESIPTEPENFVAEEITPTSILLTWNRPSTPNGIIINYTLSYYNTTETGSLSDPITVIFTPPMTSHVVQGLNEYTEYRFILTAATSAGTGPQTTTMNTTLEAAPSAGVLELRGENTSSTSLLITWQPPPFLDQNGIIRGYTISFRLNSPQNSPSMFINTTTQDENITLAQLEKFSFYEVYVSAFTIASGPEEMIIVQTDSDVPSAPVNLRYANLTSSSIRLYWDPPLQRNGILMNYKLLYVEAGTNRTFCEEDIEPGREGEGVVVDQLMEYHVYVMMVAASTDKGFGEFSLPLHVLTDEHAPDAPENLTLTTISSSSVRVTWQNPLDPNGILINFIIIIELTTGQEYLLSPSSTMFQLPSSQFEMLIGGLHPFARYEIILTARTSAGKGNATVGFITTAEDAPTQNVRNLTGNASSVAVTLTWEPPELRNWNGIISLYFIDILAVTNCTNGVPMEDFPNSPRRENYTEFNNRPNPTEAFSTTGRGEEEEEMTITGLEEFQNYQFNVTMSNREGMSPTSTLCVQTEEAAPSAPPGLDSFLIISNTTAELNWVPPEPIDRNGIIISYGIQLCTNDPLPCETITTEDNSTSYNFTDLKPFTGYVVKVMASTTAGDGPFSSPLSNTTFEGVPSMPEDLVVTSFDHNYIVLSWTPPTTPYGAIRSYWIRYQSYKVDISQETPCSVEGGGSNMTTELAANLTNLIGDSYYCIQVVAGTGAGFGNLSYLVQKVPVGPPPTDVIDPVELPEVVPKPVVDDATGDDGITDISAKVSFLLPDEINENGQVDKVDIYVQRMPSNNMEIGTYYEASLLTANWPQYATLTMTIAQSRGRKRQTEGMEVAFTVGDSSVECGPNDRVCNGPLEPNAEYGVRYTLFAGNQSQEFPFFSDATFTTERSPSSGVGNTGAIAGGIVAAILVVGIIAAIAVFIYFFLFRARRGGTIELTGYTNKKQERPLLPHRNGTTHTNIEKQGTLSSGDPGIVPLGEVKSTGSISKSRYPSKKINSRKIMLKDLGEAVRGMLNDAGYVFSEEYERVTEVGLEHSKEASLMAENRAKNRYTNILAYDHSRVKLSYVDDEPGSDYINSSYVPGYRMRRAYIATQGPLPATFDDFWRMVWEQNSHTIIMLTQLVERGRTKCHRYWPGAECIVYGEIAVEMLSEKEKDDWTVREFKLSVETITRTVWHYQFTSWPDHGVPDTPTAALDFIHTVRESVLMTHGPLVVHCSAGVGRTGCFIALDTLLQHIEEHDYIDVFGLVSEMRQHRSHMIQTEAQYVFVHKAMVEYVDTHYTGKSPTFPILYTNAFAEDSTQMTDYYGDFLSEETHM